MYDRIKIANNVMLLDGIGEEWLVKYDDNGEVDFVIARFYDGNFIREAAFGGSREETVTAA